MSFKVGVIMIIYHPFQDANHCLYRLLSILYKNPCSINVDVISFMDFYYLIPSQLKNIQNWPRKNSKNKAIVDSIQDSYEKIENPRRIFFELSDIRNNTLSHLIAKQIVTIKNNELHLDDKKLSPEFISKLESDSFRHSSIFKIITQEMGKINTSGKTGLKIKTNLMEYRYDK